MIAISDTARKIAMEEDPEIRTQLTQNFLAKYVPYIGYDMANELLQVDDYSGRMPSFGRFGR